MKTNFYIVTYKGTEFLANAVSFIDAARAMAKKLSQDSVEEFKHCALEHTFILSNNNDPIKRETFVIVRQIESLD